MPPKNNKTIALFGSTGGTGAAFLKLALKKGYKLKVLCRTPEKLLGSYYGEGSWPEEDLPEKRKKDGKQDGKDKGKTTEGKVKGNAVGKDVAENVKNVENVGEKCRGKNVGERMSGKECRGKNSEE